eukprot:gene23477-17301_t
MIVPVRCFTCGKVVADKWRAYTRMVDEDKTLTDEERGKILDTLAIKRICCRTVMLTTVDMMNSASYETCCMRIFSSLMDRAKDDAVRYADERHVLGFFQKNLAYTVQSGFKHFLSDDDTSYTDADRDVLLDEEDAIEEVDDEELIRIDEEHSHRMRAK